MAKFTVTLQKVSEFDITVEASNSAMAENEAYCEIARSGLDFFPRTEWDLETVMVRPARNKVPA